MEMENSILEDTNKSSLSGLESIYSTNLNANIDYSELNFSENSKMDASATMESRNNSLNMSITLAPNELELLKVKNQSPVKNVHQESSKPTNGHVAQDEPCNQLTPEVNATADLTSFNDITLEDSVNVAETAIDESSYFAGGCVELARRLWQSSASTQHYTKGCLWSPDGTCLLVPVHLDGMHVMELPSDLYTSPSVSKTRELSKLTSAVHVKEGGTVYDVVWYPFMNSNAPETCCWLATRQHEPIHMWDAFNGELRCSYRGYDDVDEVEAAISLTFSNDGEHIIAGYKKSIKIFDTNIPGRDCRSIPVKQAISCLALTSDNDDMVTAGSWNGYINHYDLRVPKFGSLFTLGGHNGGITWLRYAPLQNSWHLFSGARKDNKILLWDMRNYSQPVREFKRHVGTNQRIYFDLSPAQQRWLVSGDTDGVLHVWDLEQEEMAETLPLHSDCCNGVSFHPHLPILATSSGQYHFVDVTLDEETDTQSSEKIVDYENSLMLLWIGRTNS